ncbi:MAG TPA: DUF58 domain-containing protein [Solirubrobacteraceae bacterium]|nr:DUF58 domain-containing protein [Solirubrobacteraceae bacterium]
MRGALATGALGLALVLLGVAVDAEPLLVPGVALIALAAASAGWVAAAARGASVERQLSASRVMEEEPLTVRITARAGALPFPGGVLEDPLLPDAAPLRSGRSVARLRIDVRFGRRGPRTLAAPALALRDPLGVAGRRLVEGEGAEERVLVLPRVHPVTATGEGSPLQSGGRAAPIAGAAIELDGLRPYRAGAPASRIHWAALARGAGLLERRLRPEGEGRPLVVLDAAGPADADDLDAAVRAAASLGHALARGGGCSILLPGDRRATALEADGRGWPAVHARLALVAPGPAASALGAAAAGAQAVYYVAARRGARAPQRILRGHGHQRVVLVVPGQWAGRRAAFSVAGCSGYVLASGVRAAVGA